MRTGIATIPIKFKRNSFEFPSIKNIPSEPKIPLKNYLLDLIAKSDGKESSVYLKGVEKFIQEIWKEMIAKNWKTLNVKKIIPENLGVSSLSPYKRGKKGISIQNLHKLLRLWKKYCQKTNEDVREKWNEIYKSDFTFSVHKYLQPTKLPKYLTPKLSYFVGWLCGDGHMTDDANHYLVNVVDKSINQLRYVLEPLIKELFNIDSPIFIYPDKKVLQFGSKPIFRFLTQVLKIKVGEIPKIVHELDKVNKRYFLAGIFDSEGYVSKSRYRVTISQSNIEFLKKIMILSNEIGIKFRGLVTHRTALGTWYTIRLDKKDEILKFANLIGTYHIDKFPKLKEQILKIYENRYCHFTS